MYQFFLEETQTTFQAFTRKLNKLFQYAYQIMKIISSSFFFRIFFKGGRTYQRMGTVVLRNKPRNVFLRNH